MCTIHLICVYIHGCMEVVSPLKYIWMLDSFSCFELLVSFSLATLWPGLSVYCSVEDKDRLVFGFAFLYRIKYEEKKYSPSGPMVGIPKEKMQLCLFFMLENPNGNIRVYLFSNKSFPLLTIGTSWKS